MRGWNDCPRCAGTGNGEGGRGCGFQPQHIRGQGGVGGFVADHGSLREPFKEVHVASSGDGEVRVYQIPPDHPLAQAFPLDNRGPQVCEACGATGVELLSTHHAGWLCADWDTCLERCEPAEDYEALGYHETGYGHGDLDYAAYVVGFAARGIAASVIQSELQKDIRDATDIVDSGSTDSYK